MGTVPYSVKPLGLGFQCTNTHVPGMQKPLKARAVQVGRDKKIHLTTVKLRAANGFRRETLCGLAPVSYIDGIPTSHPVEHRCPACYALVDAYGYPRDLADA
jgi:hypothetical protein